MASSEEYLSYVLEQLSGLEDVSFRPMMGEYILYCDGKVVGGIYDDRFLLKPVQPVLRIMQEEDRSVQMDIPYEGAKEMMIVDIDDRELACRLIREAAESLPAKKKRK